MGALRLHTQTHTQTHTGETDTEQDSYRDWWVKEEKNSGGKSKQASKEGERERAAGWGGSEESSKRTSYVRPVVRLWRQQRAAGAASKSRVEGSRGMEQERRERMGNGTRGMEKGRKRGGRANDLRRPLESEHRTQPSSPRETE
ncbi:hypothetical protein PYCCODRAFT_1430809 [Trametes coccinea BRFM310]|uniref:Uncharacterized protein n=1 Tax=Trametes coccinea (strain BRFM310) TaxID=1353009 RepID=A0A1Y2J425_TRAC3|nr:hypothetical protein PYCCODRAFT_1430809 [Trametes coccinea BRFM310]